MSLYTKYTVEKMKSLVGFKITAVSSLDQFPTLLLEHEDGRSAMMRIMSDDEGNGSGAVDLNIEGEVK